MDARSTLLILAALVCCMHLSYQQRRCVGSLDIIFAVDGSNSMGPNNFDMQRASLARLIQQLNVSDTEIHVGLVLFSSTVSTTIQLTGNKDDVLRQVSKLQYPDESTRTDLAIDSALSMFTMYGRGGSVPKMLMVITDGASSEPKRTLDSANRAKAAGINIYAIGVTSQIDRSELETLASKKDQVIVTNDFTTLEKDLNAATNRACVNLECIDAFIDIVFVLDSSRRISQNDFQEMKSFVKDFLIFAEVDNGQIRVGVLTFSDDAYVQFQMNTYDRNKDAMNNALSNIQYRPGGSNMVAAFQTLRNTMYTERYGDRRDVPNVVIFLTASTSDVNQWNTTKEAEMLRATGTQIYGIGINLFNTVELDSIVSRPVPDNRFTVDRASNLRPLIEAVYDKFNKFCETPPPVPPCFMGQTDIWVVSELSNTAERLSRFDYPRDFRFLKEGLTEMIDIMLNPSVSNPGVRLGLVSYSDFATMNVNTNSVNSVQMARQVVQNFPGATPQGGAQVSVALQSITSPPVQSEYRSYVLLVAPESSVQADLFNVKRELDRVKQLGYTVVPIIVRDRGVLSLTDLITASSGQGFYFYIQDYKNVEAATKNFTRDIVCNGYVGPRQLTNDGLCANSGNRENGMSVVNHPDDCTKYIQCYYRPQGDLNLAVVRSCPRGLLWSQQFKKCMDPGQAMCANDACKQACEPYKMDGACGAYWECENQMSTPKCCDKGFAFVPGKGCVADITCVESCAPEKWCGYCQKKPSWDDKGKFDFLPANGSRTWENKICFYNDFDVLPCGCEARKGHVCPADHVFDFSNPTTVSNVLAGTLDGIRANGVTNNGNVLVLDKQSTIHVDSEKQADNNGPFSILFSFRERQPFSRQGAVLFSSGLNCGGSSRLVVTADDKYITAQLMSDDNKVKLSVPYQGISSNEVKTVIVAYGDDQMYLSVEGRTYQYIAKTDAPTGMCISCGVDIGPGFNKLSFNGDVQKVAVSSCLPSILYWDQ